MDTEHKMRLVLVFCTLCLAAGFTWNFYYMYSRSQVEKHTQIQVLVDVASTQKTLMWALFHKQLPFFDDKQEGCKYKCDEIGENCHYNISRCLYRYSPSNWTSVVVIQPLSNCGGDLCAAGPQQNPVLV